MKNQHLIIETFPVGSFGCNCSLIYSPQTLEAIIIDPGNDAQGLLTKIQSKSLKIKKLLHTHAHFDHIGGSGILKAHTEAPLYLHKADHFLYEALPQQAIFFGQSVPPPGPIDYFIEDEQTFGLEESATLIDPQLNDFLKAIHTPGHTPGSLCFYTEYFPTPVLFSGDTLFKQSIGRTDFPGGNTKQILSSIKDRLFALPAETQVIPGHGPFTQIFQEKKENPFVKTSS